MSLEVLSQATFTGPAFPEPFVRFTLEKELASHGLLPKVAGEEGRSLQESWDIYRRKLRDLGSMGGALRVRAAVLEPLLARLGYERMEESSQVETREGPEPGGTLFVGAGESRLRVWSTAFNEDLDAPSRRGRAYRFSQVRVSQRVLLAKGERVGLLTNGEELRLLLSDPARPDSQVEFDLGLWRKSREVPDSYRLLLALTSPEGVQRIPDLVDKARLQQTQVTKELRKQAREAVELFVQEVLDHPENREALATRENKAVLAHELWHEGLVLIYRLLCIFKLEASDDPAKAFHFASSSLWRNTFSPTLALSPFARRLLDHGEGTGRLLEDGLRTLFRIFESGLASTELNVQPLGGALFGAHSTPLLSGLAWGERACAHLLDRLLWTPKRRGSENRERVHYGSLDVEDLGRVYEALLELEPGIATEPMCRLRRQKLEVVVPEAQGEKYRTKVPSALDQGEEEDTEPIEDALETDESEEEAEAPTRGKKTKVEWIETISPDRFYLRVGLGRKSSGSYYTPHSFVRFLVQETLGPHVNDRSPQENPRPGEILKLKVADIAMGSGHFLVEADRFLGDKLYEACRLCDEKALDLERKAEKEANKDKRAALLTQAQDYRQRVLDLPDPDDELVRYLPSRAPEGEESGLSQRRAEALCKRLVAVHCLYGVDKNPLAVELARLSLWIESHAEGLPLTFLDHRLVVGDSLTGPFIEHLTKYPGAQQPMDDLFTRGITEKLSGALSKALRHVADLEASVGTNLGEIEAKKNAMARLHHALAPYKLIAAAWSGGVMLGEKVCDDAAYGQLVRTVVETGNLPNDLSAQPRLQAMIAKGLGVEEAALPSLTPESRPLIVGTIPALPFELAFPEVFYPNGKVGERKGFQAVLGNPPWDTITPKSKEFFASYEFDILNAPTQRERSTIQNRLLYDPVIKKSYEDYAEEIEGLKRANTRLYAFQKITIEGDLAGRFLDLYRVFMERNAQLLKSDGLTGVVVPSAFHANEGATGVRRLYLQEMGLKCCYSFENKHKLFEIDSRFKFAIVVASNHGPTETFLCSFYLHDDEWLFKAVENRPSLLYAVCFVQNTGGPYLAFLEAVDQRSVDILNMQYASGITVRSFCDRTGLIMQTSPTALNLTLDFPRLILSRSLGQSEPDLRRPEIIMRYQTRGYLPLHEGKTFHQFTDNWGDAPRYAVDLNLCKEKSPEWHEAIRYFRLSFREVTCSTNERTGIFAVLPPGICSSHKAPLEARPSSRTNSEALGAAGVMNSYSFDFAVRHRVQTAFSLFIFYGLPFAIFKSDTTLVSHAALRLSCNHSGYEPLWREQLGDIWREPKPPFTWPVLESRDERWVVRAIIDAVVADAYGLNRDQYAHVLSTFNHKSYPKAPELCLAAFDELKAIGLDAFTKKHDPYWDIPLNENLPQPVIDLPIPGDGDHDLVVREQGPWKKGKKGKPQGEPLPFGYDEQDQAEVLQAAEPQLEPVARKPRKARSVVDQETYQRLSNLLQERGAITSSDAQSHTGLDAASVRPYLQRLVEDKLAVMEGKKRGARYRYSGSLDG